MRYWFSFKDRSEDMAMFRIFSALIVVFGVSLQIAFAGELHDAIRANDLSALQQQLDAGADIEETDYLLGTPLHVAVTSQNEEAVRLLIENGANLEAASEIDEGRALHLVATHGQIDIASLLIDRGANLDGLDARGRTALHLAVQFKQLEMVNLLVGAGADLEISESGNHFTPLLIAANYSGLQIVKALVEAGANIEARDNGGRTVLREAATPRAWSAAGSSAEVIEYLIAQGADINAVEDNGLTILGNLRAKYGGFPSKDALIEVFERYNAR